MDKLKSERSGFYPINSKFPINLKISINYLYSSNLIFTNRGSKLAIRKDQVLVEGTFYSETDKSTIYTCHLQDTSGFLKDIALFSLLIAIFAFILMEWFSFFVVIVSWPILSTWLLPKHYRYVQINKHSVIWGVGSIQSLLMKFNLFNFVKCRYDDIHYMRFDRWEKKEKNRKKSFGRIEIKVGKSLPIFHMLIPEKDFLELLKIIEKFRFDIKTRKQRSRGELLVLFPNSPRYSQPSD